MVIYIVLLLIIYLLGCVLKPNSTIKGRKYYVVCSFFLIFLLNALRAPEIGIDLGKYYARHYADFAHLPWDNLQSVTISGDWEIGFCVFCKLLTYISENTQLFIVVTSAIIVIPYGVFIYENCEDVVFGTTAYVLYNLLFANMNTVRQALAVSIVIWGYKYLRNKQYIKYLLAVLLAASFHKSAIVALVMVVVDLVKLTKPRLILLFALLGLIPAIYSSIFTKLLGLSFLSESYDIYSSGRHAVGYVNWNSMGQFFFPMFIFALLIMYAKPWKELSKNKREGKKWRIGIIDREKLNEKNWSLSTVALGVYLVAVSRFFVFFVFVVGRLSQYFVPFMFIGFADAKKYIPDRNTRIFVKYGTYILMLLYFLYIGYRSGNANYGTVPYKFFW